MKEAIKIQHLIQNLISTSKEERNVHMYTHICIKKIFADE